MEAFITLDCSNYSENLIDILKAFKKIGWDIYNSKGEVEYLPVGDNGKYNWLWEKMSEAGFYDMISDKIANKEQVGVDLFYNNGIEGVSLLAFNPHQIMLSISINRKRVDGMHTDMVWYLENIIYKFFNAGVRLLSYRLEEFED